MNAYELELPPTIQDLVDFGAQDTTVPFQEFQLKSGEGKSRTAILFPSSGTTGAPKLILVSHYAFIANVLQAAVHDKSGCGPRRYNPGQVSCAGEPSPGRLEI
jgi:acyl-CoA synthetase (AMP-forming)/AMP-acid ligase II